MTIAEGKARQIATSSLRALARTGRAGRMTAVRLEVLRTTGLRATRGRLRQEAELRQLSEAGHGSALYRAIWDRAAEEVGARVEPLGDDFLRICRGEASTIVRGQAVPLDDAVMLALADDKRLVHQLLTAQGIAVAEQLAFDAAKPGPALRFLKADDRACVVKPLAGSGGGAGTTGGIRTSDDLLRAALKGWRWGNRLLIERQATGLVYRLLFIDGELLDVVRRRPPELIGDGRSSVARLVARENELRLAERSLVGSLLWLDLDAILTLRAQELSPDSIPATGNVVQVKSATSQNARRDNDTYRGPLSEDMIEEARVAAAAVGIRLAGVDLVTPDPTRPLREVGGAIIEVNGEPGLQHHYEVADRDSATPVAVPILERLLQS